MQLTYKGRVAEVADVLKVLPMKDSVILNTQQGIFLLTMNGKLVPLYSKRLITFCCLTPIDLTWDLIAIT